MMTRPGLSTLEEIGYTGNFDSPFQENFYLNTLGMVQIANVIPTYVAFDSNLNPITLIKQRQENPYFSYLGKKSTKLPMDIYYQIRPDIKVELLGWSWVSEKHYHVLLNESENVMSLVDKNYPNWELECIFAQLTFVKKGTTKVPSTVWSLL